MKKKVLLVALTCMTIGLAACGGEDKKESNIRIESIPSTSVEQTKETTEESGTEEGKPEESKAEESKSQEQAGAADAITQDQALSAIQNYCISSNPDLKDKIGSDDYTIYWDVTTNESNEIVVLYRSYTAAEIRYYIDPATGETYVTERVPGIIEEEQRTEESFNVKDYMN